MRSRRRARFRPKPWGPVVIISMVLVAGRVWAGPPVPLDSPLYRRLRQAIATGKLVEPRGGILHATATELSRWLAEAGMPEPPLPKGFWATPVQALSLRLSGSNAPMRPYSVPLRPRQIAGGISPSCAFHEGEPCGLGMGAVSTLDSAAGVGRWLAGGVRLLLGGGSHGYTKASVERLYLLAESSAFQVEVGRDVLALGPDGRTQLDWSRNAPPVNQLRASTAGLIPLWGINPHVIRIAALLFLARLDGPQRFPGAWISGQHVAIQLFDRLELSATRLLQFGGKGAPRLTFLQALAEHFVRRGTAEGMNYSNNRLGLGISLELPGPAWPRIYYSLVLEDTRDDLASMLRYDGDHLVGLDWEALGPAHDGRLTVEAWTTGIRSGEHGVWTTGMTTGGDFVGSPLGPDARAIAVETAWDVGKGRLGGTLMAARLAPDVYSDDGEAIRRVRSGTPELRWRARARIEWPFFAASTLAASAFAEEVRNWAFEPGHSRLELGGSVSFVWRPSLLGFPPASGDAD